MAYQTNLILKLDGLTNAAKALITQALFLWLHHYRLVQSNRATFKHAIIIEGAHHILHKQPQGCGGEAITGIVLRGIRKLGEAIVFVDQHPGRISLPARGSTYNSITVCFCQFGLPSEFRHGLHSVIGYFQQLFVYF